MPFLSKKISIVAKSLELAVLMKMWSVWNLNESGIVKLRVRIFMRGCETAWKA